MYSPKVTFVKENGLITHHGTLCLSDLLVQGRVLSDVSCSSFTNKTLHKSLTCTWNNNHKKVSQKDKTLLLLCFIFVSYFGWTDWKLIMIWWLIYVTFVSACWPLRRNEKALNVGNIFYSSLFMVSIPIKCRSCFSALL